MPKPAISLPALVHHKTSNRARVRISGRDIWLGRWGTPEAEEKYRRIVAEYLATGEPPAPPSKTPTIAPLTVTELIARYRHFCEGYYRKNDQPTTEFRVIRDSLRVVRELYGLTPAAEFGPLKLKAVREAMIAKGWRRTSINKRIGRVKRLFTWGVENEIVPPSVAHGLAAVAGLRKGRTDAAESDPVKPVPETDLNAVLPLLNRQLAAMVKLQAYTGMRPGEVCSIRPCDISRDGDVWEYLPVGHKTEHHGRDRIVFIGPKGQQILSPWLEDRPADAFCFSPIEAEAERRQAMHASRRTPLSCGNRPGTNRSRSPRRPPGTCYTNETYRRAIERACKVAEVEPWAPNRLRHTAATAIRRTFGLEAAQVCLGHAAADVTQVYAERDSDLARRVAAEIG